jgi:hypothetical protein
MLLYPLITPVPPPASWKGCFVRHASSETRPALDGDEIHVWVAEPVASPQRLHQMEQALGAGERARLPSIRTESYRSAFVETHAVLRQVLSLYTGVSPCDLKFGFDSTGRPTLLWPESEPPIRFGFVYSEPLAIVALRQCHEIDLRIVDSASVAPAGSHHHGVAFFVARHQVVTLDSSDPVTDVHLFPMDARTVVPGSESGHSDRAVSGCTGVVGGILGPDPVVGDTGGQVVHGRAVGCGRARR